MPANWAGLSIQCRRAKAARNDPSRLPTALMWNTTNMVPAVRAIRKMSARNSSSGMAVGTR